MHLYSYEQEISTTPSTQMMSMSDFEFIDRIDEEMCLSDCYSSDSSDDSTIESTSSLLNTKSSKKGYQSFEFLLDGEDDGRGILPGNTSSPRRLDTLDRDMEWCDELEFNSQPVAGRRQRRRGTINRESLEDAFEKDSVKLSKNQKVPFRRSRATTENDVQRTKPSKSSWGTILPEGSCVLHIPLGPVEDDGRCTLSQKILKYQQVEAVVREN